MIVYDSIWNVANFPEISWYIMAYYLDFIQLPYISLTFCFTFSPFESLSQDFSLFQNGSKFWNFGLGDGKIWKSQYHIFLQKIIKMFQDWLSLANKIT